MTYFRLPDPLHARRRWETSHPFPHLVVPDALWGDVAAAAAAEYPPPDSTDWHTFDGEHEEGKQEGRAEIAGRNVAEIHGELASDGFLHWLRIVSSVPDLIADPMRTGGGIHQSGEGAHLDLHVDFNVHPDDDDLVRAVNLILFVGPAGEWPDSGGYLKLGAPGLSQAQVAPVAGTLVVFQVGEDHWHGHPDPIWGDVLRRSIPAYFYRPLRDGETVEAHSTRFYEEAHL